MRQRIYLDTSVISAIGDTRAPDRQAMSRELWARIAAFDACTSDVARLEIQNTRDPQRRAEMLALLPSLTAHPVTLEAQDLASEYLAAGIFPQRCRKMHSTSRSPCSHVRTP